MYMLINWKTLGGNVFLTIAAKLRCNKHLFSRNSFACVKQHDHVFIFLNRKQFELILDMLENILNWPWNILIRLFKFVEHMVYTKWKPRCSIQEQNNFLRWQNLQLPEIPEIST